MPRRVRLDARRFPADRAARFPARARRTIVSVPSPRRAVPLPRSSSCCRRHSARRCRDDRIRRSATTAAIASRRREQSGIRKSEMSAPARQRSRTHLRRPASQSAACEPVDGGPATRARCRFCHARSLHDNAPVLQYILRRFLQMIPITFGILTLVFSLIHLIPGDPAVQIAGENARPEDVQQVRRALGLDQPLWSQYVTYVTHVLRGDLGRSFQTNEAVTKQIAQRYPATMQLAFGSMLVALIVAFPLGIISAIYRNSWIDNLARFF